ncbi:uncharacterized protein J3D65DRAFT_70168 [Phyllosticta citribraziliensis]|uniref:Uncharacterized protein n=1 Tax=Phyllosticta citribraziliensis TaxID=989973 RepID=A0ABR1LCZ0_9PEZI
MDLTTTTRERAPRRSLPYPTLNQQQISSSVSGNLASREQQRKRRTSTGIDTRKIDSQANTASHPSIHAAPVRPPARPPTALIHLSDMSQLCAETQSTCFTSGRSRAAAHAAAARVRPAVPRCRPGCLSGQQPATCQGPWLNVNHDDDDDDGNDADGSSCVCLGGFADLRFSRSRSAYARSACLGLCRPLSCRSDFPIFLASELQRIVHSSVVHPIDCLTWAFLLVLRCGRRMLSAKARAT